MAIITTHAGGPYYVWRQSVMGSPPPASFDEWSSPEGVLYHDWQHGIARAQARIDYSRAQSIAIVANPPPELTVPIPPVHTGTGAPASPPPGLIPPPPPPVAQPVATPPIDVVEAPIGFAGDIPGFDRDQSTNIRIVVQVGRNLHAPTLALLAMLDIGHGENNFHSYGCNSGGFCGFFQLSSSLQRERDYHDIAYWAGRAYQGGFWKYPGLIPLAHEHPNYSPGRLANMCQGAYDNLDTGAAYYDQGTALARSILAHTTGIAISGVGSSPAPAPAPPAPPIGALIWPGGVPAINAAGNIDNAWAHLAQGASAAKGGSKALLRYVTGITYVKPSE